MTDRYIREGLYSLLPAAPGFKVWREDVYLGKVWQQGRLWCAQVPGERLPRIGIRSRAAALRLLWEVER